MSRTLSYVIPAEWAGRTVKDFCRQRLGLSSRAFVKQKHLPGGLSRNGAPCRSVDLLAEGDILALRLPREEAAYEPVAGPLEILWETEDYLVVNKPTQMPVHPSPGHSRDSLLNRVAHHYQETGQSPVFRPLYRLDRDTSGLVAIGKSRAAVSSAQVEKGYYAVCQGPLSGAGEIREPIGLEPGSKIRRRCGEGGLPAATRWKVLATGEGHTLLELSLETGRTHQVRVHMAHLGHPLAGDNLYGGERGLLARQALHCGWMRLSCPPLGVDRLFHCPFPEDWLRAFPWTGSLSPQDDAT